MLCGAGQLRCALGVKNPPCKRSSEEWRDHVSIPYMNVDPRRLRVLLAVVRAAGVIGASRMLHLTPQAVSQQLSLLEAELGVPLFDRANRRLVPTEIGLSLAAHAERIEAELVAAGRTVSAATGRTLGVVRIAAFQSAIRWLVVEALPVLRAEQPGVIPMIIELTGAAIENALRAGEVDLVIDERDDDQPDPSTRATAVQLIRRDPYCVVAPSPLARTLRRLRDLHSARWITGPKTGACHAALERLGPGAPSSPPSSPTSASSSPLSSPWSPPAKAWRSCPSWRSTTPAPSSPAPSAGSAPAASSPSSAPPSAAPPSRPSTPWSAPSASAASATACTPRRAESLSSVRIAADVGDLDDVEADEDVLHRREEARVVELQRREEQDVVGVEAAAGEAGVQAVGRGSPAPRATCCRRPVVSIAV